MYTYARTRYNCNRVLPAFLLLVMYVCIIWSSYALLSYGNGTVLRSTSNVYVIIVLELEYATGTTGTTGTTVIKYFTHVFTCIYLTKHTLTRLIIKSFTILVSFTFLLTNMYYFVRSLRIIGSNLFITVPY